MKSLYGVSSILLIVSLAFSAVPTQINYQGSLARNDGTPLDTTTSIQFRIYDLATGSNVLWSETHPAIGVEGGLFNVVLGDVVPLPDSLWKRSSLWLGMTVGSNSEMTPRERVVAVPYAMRVASVDSAAGGAIVGDIAVFGNGNIGENNVITDTSAFVVGKEDTATGDYSSVSGGYRNAATGSSSHVGGGYQNKARDSFTNVGGGNGNIAETWCSTVSGGQANRTSGSHSVIGGGISNVATANNSTIGGGSSNSATGTSSSVQGGYENTASGAQASISGGSNNTASSTGSSIAGGTNNQATNIWSYVGGGNNNQSSGMGSSVCGGQQNSASGNYSITCGGQSNHANGAYSFASGFQATAANAASFVWSDASFGGLSSSDDNSFNVKATGGVNFYSNSARTSGVWLVPGASAWISASDSALKRNARDVDTKSILFKAIQLPIKQWSYRSQDPNIEHIGPMAQDFWNLFHIGDDSLTISTIDPSGVALAAIQELAKQNEELKLRIEQLEAKQEER